MLSAEEIDEITNEFPNYADKRSTCIDALKIVQRHRGWVNDEALQDLAEFLEMTPEDLDGVATFYNLIYRKPVGKHIILLCNSVSCWVMGYEHIHQQLVEKLGVDFGGTTPDGRFTLLPIVCLGICDHAPAMMVDDDTHVALDTVDLNSLLDRYQ